MFSVKRTVKLGETDAAGRLYFLSPLNWCQEAFEEFLLEKNFKLMQMIKGEFQTPVVHVECDFQASALVGDTVTVSIKNIEIKNSSFCVSYQIFIEEKLLSEAKMTHVCVDSSTGKSSQLPGSFKKLLIS